jgi:hypothetical protein
MTKNFKIELIVIVGLTITLVTLNEFNLLNTLNKYPFIPLYAMYLIGRRVGEKKKNEQ